MQKEMNELIDAAEEQAKLYDDDDRDCIKVDVMNAFFAGAEYAKAAYKKAEVDLSRLKRYYRSNKCMENTRKDGGWVKFKDVRELIATPPATTVASTVLTDERIEVIFKELGVAGEPMPNTYKFARAIEREVAAQAGQVAATGLSEEQLDRIARNYFSEQWAVQHVKEAIHDALTKAGAATKIAFKGKFANLRFLVDEYVKEDSKESDWSEEKLNRLQGEISQEAYPRLLQELLSMAAAQLPSKEAK